MTLRRTIAAGIVLVVFGTLVFVWPTPYRYVDLHLHDLQTVARVNRLTGCWQALGPEGWGPKQCSLPFPDR